MEDNSVHPPFAAEGGASSAAPVLQYHNNYSHPFSRNRLHDVVLQLPIDHITSYLSNTSVAFLALAIDPTYSSHDGSDVAGASNEALDFLMEEEGRRGRWADICLDCVDWINDNDVKHLLSLVVEFDATALKRLTIRDCPGVDGTGLRPLISQVGLNSLIFHDNGLLPRRSSRLAEGGWTPLENVQSTFNGITHGEHYLEYVRIPVEWTGTSYEKGWEKEKGLHVIHCSSNCCGEGPIQALFWCHFCGYGSFCERSAGDLFVFCQDKRIACCVNCIRYGVHPVLLPNTFAIRCGHTTPNTWGCRDQCNRWFCACRCGRGNTWCFECDTEICHSCVLGQEYCVDIEYKECRERRCNCYGCYGRRHQQQF